MSNASLVDVLTVPGYRRGPSVLGMAVIALLFLVPGFVAPIGLLQLVGAIWLVAAVITAVRDARHLSRCRTRHCDARPAT